MAENEGAIYEETGAELVARLAKRTSIEGIDHKAFGNLTAGSVVEVSGCAKTEFLYHQVVKCLLPSELNGITLEGLKVSVIFVDNDCKLSLARIVDLLKIQARRALENAKHDQLFCDEEWLEICVKESLSRLSIINCYSSDEFFVTLHALQKLIGSNNQISLLIIDSFSAFYWADRLNTMDNCKLLADRHNKMCLCLKNIAKDLKVSIFLTKQSLMKPLPQSDSSSSRKKYASNSYEFMGPTFQKLIDHRIKLEASSVRFADKTVIKANVTLYNNKSTNYMFSISSNGLTIL